MVGHIRFNFSSNKLVLIRKRLLYETLAVTINIISKVIGCLLSEQMTDLDLTSVGEIWGRRFHEQNRFCRNRILQLGSMLTSSNKTIEKNANNNELYLFNYDCCYSKNLCTSTFFFDFVKVIFIDCVIICHIYLTVVILKFTHIQCYSSNIAHLLSSLSVSTYI